MSTVPPAVPRASSPAAFTGPLVWRKVVDWLSADGVISADEAQRTIARCSQAESAQNPLVRLSNVAMARASDGRPLDIEALTEYLAQRAGLPYLRIDPLRVVLADAAQEIRNPMWLGTVDGLCVDLYDDNAAAPVLDSAEFYADCRALLSEDGCMTVNLFGRSSSFERSLQSMATAFGEEALWAFKPTREGNTVVLAQRTPSRPKRAELMARAEVVQERWGLPATKWLRVFKPVVA